MEYRQHSKTKGRLYFMLKDYKAGERFEGIVLVNEWKEVSFRQKPGAYLSLMCQDSSGMIQGKMWNYDPKVLGWLNDQDVFRVKGVVSEYRGALDLTIETIRMIPQDAVSYTHLRAHETRHDLVCRLLLEKKKKQHR